MNSSFESAKLVNAEFLAERYSVTSRTILNWAERGEIPVAIRKGRVVRFDVNDVDEALRADWE